MSKRCFKCNYVAQADSAACPACGAAYATTPAMVIGPAKIPDVAAPQPAPTYGSGVRSIGGVAMAGRITLGFVAGLSLLFGIGSALFGTSAIHQILTGVYFLIFTVALTGLIVAETIRAAAK